MASLTLIAQEPAPAKSPDGKQPEGLFGGPGGMLLPIALMVLFFFVVMYPAQRRARKQQQEMLTNLKPGKKVVLSSGIVGTVVKVHETEGELTIRSDDARVRVLKSSIVSVSGEETTEAKS